jgi:lysozyme family protein
MDSKINAFIHFIRKWEGGLSRHTSDSASSYPCPTSFNGKSGYHTNCGITYASFVHTFGHDNDSRFLTMNSEDWFKVFKTSYWDGVKADSIKDITVAIFMTEIAWGSGTSQAIKTVQKCVNQCGLKIAIDGSIGMQTITAINSVNSRELLMHMFFERDRFFRAIAKGKNSVFLKGWLNRLNDFKACFYDI